MRKREGGVILRELHNALMAATKPLQVSHPSVDHGRHALAGRHARQDVAGAPVSVRRLVTDGGAWRR